MLKALGQGEEREAVCATKPVARKMNKVGSFSKKSLLQVEIGHLCFLAWPGTSTS